MKVSETRIFKMWARDDSQILKLEGKLSDNQQLSPEKQTENK